MIVRNKEKEKKRKSAVKLIVINEEELIRQVSLRPVIYDRSLKAYRKTSLRHQCWKEISETMDVTVVKCRKRWRSLRDTFVKRYKQIQSTTDESVITKLRKWYFYDKMAFLIPHLDGVSFDYDNIVDEIGDNSEDAKSISCESIALSSANDVLEANNQTIRTSVRTLNEHNVSDEMNDVPHSSPSSTPFVSIPMNITNDDNDIKSCATEKASFRHHECPLQGNIGHTPIVNSHSTETITDNNSAFLIESDEKFLLSCAPALRRLTTRQNALARLKIQQILYDIEFAQQLN